MARSMLALTPRGPIGEMIIGFADPGGPPCAGAPINAHRERGARQSRDRELMVSCRALWKSCPYNLLGQSGDTRCAMYL
jgi:hypothetical protein